MSGYLGGDDFRRVMRHVPSPVMVLTFTTSNGPHGVTIGSFASVSLKPPLVSFNLMNEGSSAESIRDASHFAIHVLRNDQVSISEWFAKPDVPNSMQFESIDYGYAPEGVPILDDCLATLVCKQYDLMTAGDHTVILGEVLRADVLNPSKPLLYFQRSYHEIGDSL